MSERVLIHWNKLPREVGGVTIPEGVWKIWRCGTEEHGQWAWWGGLRLVLGISKVFSDLDDSVILWNTNPDCAACLLNNV